MKRFYCTICKRIKRVRKYPADIQNQYSDSVGNRIGTCTRHIKSGQSEQINGRFNRTHSVKVGR